MRWGGALVALFLFLALCLLVVAIRVRTLALRARLHAVHQDSLHLEAENAGLAREIAQLGRTRDLRMLHMLTVRDGEDPSSPSGR